MLELPIQMLTPGALAPQYAHVGDAGLDLRCTEDFTLAPFERKCIPCGFAMQLPRGYAAYVLPRSGLALKHGITLVNSPGLIDSNYRGEIKVLLSNMDPRETFSAKAGERIAQMVIIKVEEVATRVVATLDETERGAAGFGSSGTA